MTFMVRSWKHIFSRGSFLPKNFTTKLGPLLPAETLVEEERLPFYDPLRYYPVKIGDVYQSRYRVVGKLGYGAYSTVWLCRDLWSTLHAKQEFLALKISTSLRGPHRESNIYEHLSKIDSSNPGQTLVRELHDTFELRGPDGPHRCLLQPPMHMDVLEMMNMSGRPLTVPMLKMVFQRLLAALDFLHNEANVIHTDIKSDNLMLTIKDHSMLERFETTELETPSPRKIVDASRVIYQTRHLGPSNNSEYGLPVLCDLGQARLGKVQSGTPFVQPHIYRAPEVIFEMQWGPPVDIWNVACLMWDLFEGKHLFEHIFDNRGHHDPFLHLARMVSLIGPPPSKFVKRSETTEQCFDDHGGWIAQEDASVTPTALEEIEMRLAGDDKASFIGFLRKMLRWLPEERKTAKELLEDPWLRI